MSVRSEHLQPTGLDTHPAALHKRLELAENTLNTARFTHAAQNQYIIETTETKYLIDLPANPHHPARCTCPDHQYRGQRHGYDCKHILAVKQAIKNERLAPPETPPTEWLHEQLDMLADAAGTSELTLSHHQRVQAKIENARENLSDCDIHLLAKTIIIELYHPQPSG